MGVVSAIESITLGVQDLGASVAFYRDVLGLDVVLEEAGVSVGLLGAWKRPVHETARVVELGTSGSRFGRIRLAYFENGSSTRTRQDFGPDATDSPTAAGPLALGLETAQPLAAVLERLRKASCTVRSEPVRHSGDAEKGTQDYETALVSVPGDVALMLTGRPAHGSGSSRQTVASALTTGTADVTLITGNVDASRRFYVDCFGWIVTTDEELQDDHRDALCRIFGIREIARVRHLTLQSPEAPAGRIHLLHFPGVECPPLAHPMRPGQVGVNLFTCCCDELSDVLQRCQSLEFEVVSEPTHVGFPMGRPGRVMVVRGPSQELFELVDLAA